VDNPLSVSLVGKSHFHPQLQHRFYAGTPLLNHLKVNNVKY